MIIKKQIYNYLLKHAIERTALGKKIGKHGLAFHQAYENWNYNFKANGENHVVRILGEDLSIQTVFDVGANVGEWSEMMYKSIAVKNSISIHSFEIVPSTYNELHKRLSETKGVFLHNVGMSNEVGEIEVFVSEKNDLSSCLGGHEEKCHRRKSCRWCNRSMEIL